MAWRRVARADHRHRHPRRTELASDQLATTFAADCPSSCVYTALAQLHSSRPAMGGLLHHDLKRQA